MRHLKLCLLFFCCYTLVFYQSVSKSSTILAGNNALITSTNIPSTIAAGTTSSVTITVKNTGTTTWSSSGNYKLGSYQDDPTWGFQRVYLGATQQVSPNQSTTFTFDITAPYRVGDYNFQVRMVQDGVEWFGAISTSTDITVTENANVNELSQRLMMGYQGWFLTEPDDSKPNEWRHWFEEDGWKNPIEDYYGADMWPDMSEYSETYATDMHYDQGETNPAELFSSYDLSTTRKHFEWMEDYNIYGVYLQRFVNELGDSRFLDLRDTVLSNILTASSEYNRKFAIMYDLSNMDNRDIFTETTDDWEYLKNQFDVANSSNYVKQHDKPVIAIWGVGFTSRNLHIDSVQAVINYFKNEGMYVVGGVPDGWRDLSGSSESGSAWKDVYESLDMISPWTVGSYATDPNKNWQTEVDNWNTNKIQPDLDTCAVRGQDYMPVVWPGFSSHNIHPEKPYNEVPRRGGDFFWRQTYNAINSGSQFIYVAMFDEVDEGTAMFKTAETEDDVPYELRSKVITLDEEGTFVPSDWYLQLADEAQKMLDGTISLTSTIPINAPQQGNQASFVSQSVPSTLYTNEQATVTVTMKNEGSTTWSASGNYKIGSQNPQDTTIWGFNRVSLDSQDEISFEQTKTFEFTITAPSASGNYNFQWKMVQDGVEWFGDQSTNVSIQVISPYLDDCESDQGWNTASGNTLALSGLHKQGDSSVQMTGSATNEYSKIFSPYDTQLEDADAVLQFWYYISNTSAMTGNNQVELGSGGKADSAEYNWTLPPLVSGEWNLINLDISDANVIDSPDLNALTWFRLYNFKNASVTTRLDGIRIIDKESIYIDECETDSGWNTGFGNSISTNSINSQQGSGSVEMTGTTTHEFSKVFSPAFNSGLSAANARLEFWYYVSNSSNMSLTNNQVELGSGGEADAEEYHWTLTSLQTGWNFIQLDLSSAGTTGGTPDLDAIDWFRIYNSKSGSVTNRIDGIRLVSIASARIAEEQSAIIVKENYGLKVFPNPTSERLNLEYVSDNPLHLRMYDLAGTSVLSRQLEKGTHQLTLSVVELKRGIYFIEILNGNKRKLEKVIIK